MPTETMTVTAEMIDRLKTERGGWNREGLALMGVSWPPVNGWKKSVIGRKVQVDAAELSREERKAKGV